MFDLSQQPHGHRPALPAQALGDHEPVAAIVPRTAQNQHRLPRIVVQYLLHDRLAGAQHQLKGQYIMGYSGFVRQTHLLGRQ